MTGARHRVNMGRLKQVYTQVLAVKFKEKVPLRRLWHRWVNNI
jgi:hypothetical protein